MIERSQFFDFRQLHCRVLFDATGKQLTHVHLMPSSISWYCPKDSYAVLSAR